MSEWVDCPKCGYPNTANGNFKGIYTPGHRCEGCGYVDRDVINSKFNDQLRKYDKLSAEEKLKTLEKIGILDKDGNLTPQYGGTGIPSYCAGENCTMCGTQAMHKIEEYTEDYGHPHTAYVCNGCFNKIMKPQLRSSGRKRRR